MTKAGALARLLGRTGRLEGVSTIRAAGVVASAKIVTGTRSKPLAGLIKSYNLNLFGALTERREETGQVRHSPVRQSHFIEFMCGNITYPVDNPARECNILESTRHMIDAL